MITKTLFLFMLFPPLGGRCSDLIRTGIPDLGVEIRKITYETYTKNKIIVSLSDRNHGQLKEVRFVLDGKDIFLGDDKMNNICSVDLHGIEIYQITKSKNNKVFSSKDFYIIIPFNDYYENCDFPANYDELPYSEYELEIRIIKNNISNTDIEKLK